MKQNDSEELKKIIEMLDGFAASGESRLKIETSEEMVEGESRRQYHHGRCDTNSPWARGCAFDVLEDKAEN